MKTLKSNIESVPFTEVKIEDDFWAPRIKVNREQTIPYQYEQCKETGRIDAFRLDWKKGMEPVPHVFWDSDVAKWIEAASYSLAVNPDSELDSLLDQVIDLIERAQQPDGYLNIYFTVVEPGKRWTNVTGAHELYCAGHLIEAGIAHFEATQKKTLLDVVCRYADYIDTVFGPEEGKKKGYPGHEEIELALVKLFKTTGESRYLRLSRYFVDERGKEPNYFDIEQGKNGQSAIYKVFDHPKEYNQSYKPVREQDKVTGHAVRAMYLYSAMADLAKETEDRSLLDACERLWDNLHRRNLYITGGIGQTHENEGFTFDFDLPNRTAYAETCAAVGLVFWNHRMLHLDCDGRYADAMERALYNGVLSGVSLDGKRFFYDNPLESLGDKHREEWFGCACCPPNLARLLASLGQYIYSQTVDTAVVHLYVQGNGQFKVNNQNIILKQRTQYPWDGNVRIELEVEHPEFFGIKLRIPNWCRNARLLVNNEAVDITEDYENGYTTIRREWKKEDKIELQLPMSIERIYSHPEVRQNKNRVALQRGPVVYCLEETDNLNGLYKIKIPRQAQLTSVFEKELLGGVVKIVGDAEISDDQDWNNQLYGTVPPVNKHFQFEAVPYYAWDNREQGEMCVWIHEG